MSKTGPSPLLQEINDWPLTFSSACHYVRDPVLPRSVEVSSKAYIFKYWFRHTGFTLLNADVACLILLFIPLTIPPSYSTQLPAYLNSWTCSIVFPLHVKIKVELGVAMLFDFSTITFSLIFRALSPMVSSSSCKPFFASSKPLLSILGQKNRSSSNGVEEGHKYWSYGDGGKDRLSNIKKIRLRCSRV